MLRKIRVAKKKITFAPPIAVAYTEPFWAISRSLSVAEEIACDEAEWIDYFTSCKIGTQNKF